jgi:hypothetical protein
VCGIDQQCDPASGRCVFVKPTPLPCVESAKFDEKSGFCLPTGAPTPVPLPPEPTFDFRRDPRFDRSDQDSRDNDSFPFNESDEDTPRPDD